MFRRVLFRSQQSPPSSPDDWEPTASPSPAPSCQPTDAPSGTKRMLEFRRVLFRSEISGGRRKPKLLCSHRSPSRVHVLFSLSPPLQALIRWAEAPRPHQQPITQLRPKGYVGCYTPVACTRTHSQKKKNPVRRQPRLLRCAAHLKLLPGEEADGAWRRAPSRSPPGEDAQGSGVAHCHELLLGEFAVSQIRRRVADLSCASWSRQPPMQGPIWPWRAQIFACIFLGFVFLCLLFM